jgi:hypothetical protein
VVTALRGIALGVLVPLLVGARCGGGDGSGGSPVVFENSSLDPRCVALADSGGFPPGYDFVPEPGGGASLRLLVATAARSNLIPLDIETVPFRIPDGATNYLLPADSDGDGMRELFKSIDDIEVVSPSLALVTVSGTLDAVLFVDPGAVGPRTALLSVPADFDPTSFAAQARLPAPGASRLQTGVPTSACVHAGPAALDSRGEPLATSLPPSVWCDGPGTYPATFTAGAALVGERLFSVTSNLGAGQGQQDTQFLPGSVVVYDLDASVDSLALSPSQEAPGGGSTILTSGFNPTHATPFTTGAGRSLLLVTLTGAIGIRADDPSTDEPESGAIRITEGAIDVIDAEALELVATIPLADANPSFEGVAIDPSGRVGLFGDVNARHVYGVDLALLETLPPAGSGGQPVSLEAAVIFDGLNPLVLPARPGGAPAASCPGRITGVAFDDIGDTAYALDACDGTIAALDVDLSGDPSLAQLRTRIRVRSSSPATAPLRVDTLGQVRSPSALAVRPGRPGLDYAGPDVFFLIGDPEGYLCGVRIDAR